MYLGNWLSAHTASELEPSVLTDPARGLAATAVTVDEVLVLKVASQLDIGMAARRKLLLLLVVLIFLLPDLTL